MTNSVKVTITDERVLHALELIANAKQSSVRDWIVSANFGAPFTTEASAA